jgi:hypothetical protein
MMGAGENGEFLYTPERPGLQKLTINTQLAGWYVPMQIFVRPAKKVVAGLDLPSLAARQEKHSK